MSARGGWCGCKVRLADFAKRCRPLMLGSDGMQALVACPQPGSRGHLNACEQMHVHITDVQPGQPMPVDERQHFGIGGNGCLRQVVQSIQYRLTLLQMAECQFTNHERMRQHLAGFEQARQRAVAGTQVIDPDRGIGFSSGSLPPRRARRPALSRSIKARRASRTKADFSFRPVNCWALLTNSSSKASVVRMIVIQWRHLAVTNVASNDAIFRAHASRPRAEAPGT